MDLDVDTLEVLAGPNTWDLISDHLFTRRAKERVRMQAADKARGPTRTRTPEYLERKAAKKKIRDRDRQRRNRATPPQPKGSAHGS